MKKIKELVSGKENGTSHSRITEATKLRNVEDVPQTNSGQPKPSPSIVPLPPSSSEEKLRGNDSLDLELKAPSVQTPGDVEAAADTPNGPHPAPAKHADKTPSSPLISTFSTKVPMSKRKLSPTSSVLGKRRTLFTRRKKLKDASWTTLQNSSPPVMQNNAHTPINPEPKCHHAPPQPTLPKNPPHQLDPNQDQLKTLRSLRDDIVNQIGQQHARTLQEMGKKVDLLTTQNAVLSEKLNAIIEALGIPKKEKPSNFSPTPPLQLPSFLLNVGTNAMSPKPPPPPPHPPSTTVDCRAQPRSKGSQSREKPANHPTGNMDSMSIDQAELDSLHGLHSSAPSVSHPRVNPTHENRNCQSDRRNDDTQWPTEWIRHFSWLKKQFVNCFGLPTDTYKRREVYSFDGIKIAEGFNKVVATWQGLYYELKGEDIIFENLDRNFSTARGVSIFSTKGVEIFKRHREDHRTTPRAHRFAVIPGGHSSQPCNPLQVGKFYVHIYQTKLKLDGNFMKTLNSKAIARALKEMYGERYLPRPRDLEREQHQHVNDDQGNLNSPRYERPPQYDPQYEQEKRRQAEITNNPAWKTFPLAHNPPPLPFKPQNINWPTRNTNSMPSNYGQIRPTVNQYQQSQNQQWHWLPYQSHYNPKWPTTYQNTVPNPYQPNQQLNLMQNDPAQQPNVSYYCQNNPQDYFTGYQYQQPGQQQYKFGAQPPGVNRNYN